MKKIRKKPKINAKSIPVILHIDQHIRSCRIRGKFSCFRDAAADPCDGMYFRKELKDLVRRGFLKVVRYGYDDSMGRDPDRDRDKRLCGVTWSVNPTKRFIRAFWPDRLGKKARA